MLHYKNNISNVYYGNKKIGKIYKGNNLVYSGLDLTSLTIVDNNHKLDRYGSLYNFITNKPPVVGISVIILNNKDVYPPLIGYHFIQGQTLVETNMYWQLNIQNILSYHNITRYRLKYNIRYTAYGVINIYHKFRLADGYELPRTINDMSSYPDTWVDYEYTTGELTNNIINILYAFNYRTGTSGEYGDKVYINQLEIIKVS